MYYKHDLISIHGIALLKLQKDMYKYALTPNRINNQRHCNISCQYSTSITNIRSLTNISDQHSINQSSTHFISITSCPISAKSTKQYRQSRRLNYFYKKVLTQKISLSCSQTYRLNVNAQTKHEVNAR